MTLVIKKPTTTRLVMRKGWQPMDSDAATYISAVEAADGQALEEKTKIAIDNFVLGCKADGIWSAIKASCILAGARTLNGALVPLAGVAPTNFNFVSGDYNRKTGLVGNGSTKYLDSNRAGNADPRNSCHVAVRITSVFSASEFVIGTADTADFTGVFVRGSSLPATAVRSGGNAFLQTATSNQVGFIGASRSTASSANSRIFRSSLTVLSDSVVPDVQNFFVFASPSYTSYRGTGRLAFYSIGESLNLALLDARVTDLINALGAAIP